MCVCIHVNISVVVYAQVRMTQFSSEKDKAKRRLETHQTRLKEINNKIVELESQVTEIRENAKIAEQAASMNCERVKTKRKRKEVESEITKFKKFIEKQLPRIEEQDLIRQQYSEAMEKYKETMALIKKEWTALKVSVCMHRKDTTELRVVFTTYSRWLNFFVSAFLPEIIIVWQ